MSKANKPKIVKLIKTIINENEVIGVVVNACIDALMSEGRTKEESEDMIRDMFNEIIKGIEYVK